MWVAEVKIKVGQVYLRKESGDYIVGGCSNHGPAELGRPPLVLFVGTGTVA